MTSATIYAAVIRNGIVCNRIILEADTDPDTYDTGNPDDTIVVIPADTPVDTGWSHDGDTFTPPADEQPGEEPTTPTNAELAAQNADMQAQIDALMDLMLGA